MNFGAALTISLAFTILRLHICDDQCRKAETGSRSYENTSDKPDHAQPSPPFQVVYCSQIKVDTPEPLVYQRLAVSIDKPTLTDLHCFVTHITA